jgi:transcriptional regulator with GAF, ATPase, and Fis domain
MQQIGNAENREKEPRKLQKQKTKAYNMTQNRKIHFNPAKETQKAKQKQQREAEKGREQRMNAMKQENGEINASASYLTFHPRGLSRLISLRYRSSSMN